MRLFLKELSLILILLSALYRAFVLKPLGLDVYLLYLPGLCFAPLLVTLLLSYRWNNRLEVIKLMLGLVVFFLWLCPVKFGGLVFSPAKGDYSLVTLNVQAYEADLDKIARTLRSMEVDAICLQEVWSRPQFDVLKASLSDYQLLLSAEDMREENYFQSGVVVAVRKNAKHHTLSSGAGFVAVEVEAPGGRFIVVSYHGRKAHKYDPVSLLQTFQLQVEQSQALLAALSSQKAPVLIGGDWNSPSSGPALKVLSGYRSAFFEVGRGLGVTFPASFPLVRLDQVLGSSGVQFRKMSKFQAGSDHLGVRVEFSI